MCSGIFLCHALLRSFIFFFFNDTATTEIYTLSLHDALPISYLALRCSRYINGVAMHHGEINRRSEEHTSELQSPDHLVCRLLLEKKKNIQDECNRDLHVRQTCDKDASNKPERAREGYQMLGH